MHLNRRAFQTLLLGSLVAGRAAHAETARKSGGNLTFLLASLESGWGPNERVDNYTGMVWGQIADKLLHVDNKGQPTPWIAERWDANATQTEFVLHLKSDVAFSDGTPVDAKAVAANIELWAKGDPSRGIGRLGLFPSTTYKACEVVDDHTLRVLFTSPTLSFIPTLGYHKTVLRALSSLNAKAEDLGNLDRQLGSGPFVVKSWRENDSVVLVRRPDYRWGPAVIDHAGPASFDSITFKVVKDGSLRGAALQAGQAEVVLNIAPQEFQALKDKGIKVVAPDSLGFVSGFAVNTQAPHFGELAVRQAVQSAIDRAEILRTVFTSDWVPATTFLQPNVPEAADFSAILAYDPQKAARLLDDAGWKTGADGVRTRNGDKLRFNLYASPWVSTSRQVDELVTQQLLRVGIAAKLQVVDVPTFDARVRGNNNFPLVEVSRSFLDAGVVGNVLTDADKGDDWFKLGSSNDTLNRFASEIASAVDRTARAQTLKSVQHYVLEQGLFIPTTQLLQRLYVQSPRLHGDVYSGGGYPLYYGAWLA